MKTKMADAHTSETAAALSIILVARRRRRKKKRQRQATMPYIIGRKTYGAFHAYVQEMAECDPCKLKKFLRMSGETFNELLRLVAPLVEKTDTSFKESIPPEERLAVTLRYLAQGGTYVDLFTLFLIPETTLSYLIPDVCDAIYAALKDRYMKTPSTEAEWRAIQEKFYTRWQFPQCLGAMDGKHVRIQCPSDRGSQYYCYKEFHSIVLFAIVDADYRFIYYEVGAAGRVGDATIWNSSPFRAALEGERIHAPGPVTTPGNNTPIPSLIVADSAFALSPRLMKPYTESQASQAEKVFNYRLFRACRIVENAFGHLAARFGVYQKAMKVQPRKVKKIVLATLALHNFLCHSHDQQYFGPGSVDTERGEEHEVIKGEWRRNPNAHLHGLQPAHTQGNQHHLSSGTQTREALCQFFMGHGAVPWQFNNI